MLGSMEILPLAVVAALVVVVVAVGVSGAVSAPAATRPSFRLRRKQQFCIGYGASAWEVGDLAYQDGRSLDVCTREPVPEGWYRILRRVVPKRIPGALAIGSAELWVEPAEPPEDLTADERFLGQVKFPRKVNG